MMNDLAATITPLEFLDALRTRARIGLCFVDASLRYIWVNDALSEMLGFDADELAGMNVADVTHPDDRDLDERLSARAFNGEISHFTTRKRFIGKNQETITADLMASVMHDEDGNSLGGFATVVPIAL